MIVEDEFGNDIDLSDERAQADQRDGEPPDPEPALTLEEIEAAYNAACAGGASVEGKEAAAICVDAIPQMLAELRRWRALRSQQQHGVVTMDDGRSVWQVFADAENVRTFAEVRGGKAGVRTVYVTPWELLWEQPSDEPPF